MTITTTTMTTMPVPMPVPTMRMTPNAARARATRQNIVRRINEKLSPKHFLVTKRATGAPGGLVYRAGRFLVTYCLAQGSPRTARYEVVNSTPLDLAETAGRLGIRLTDLETDALEMTARDVRPLC